VYSIVNFLVPIIHYTEQLLLQKLIC